MTGKDILTALGGIEDKYIQEAEYGSEPLQFREKRPVRKLTKIAMIAAVLSLFLTGCAYAVFKVQDMMYEEVTVTQRIDENGETIEPTERIQVYYTPFGLTDGPIAKAYKEWNEYLDSLGTVPLTEEGIKDVPENLYFNYECFNTDMVDKLLEITDKYSLTLLDTWCFAHENQKDIMYDAMGIDGILRTGLEADVIEEPQGVFESNGNFEESKRITLTGADAVWREELYCTFTYAKKNTFWERMGSVTKDHYDQWNYTSADGTELLLILDQYGHATILADAGDSFIYIQVMFDSVKNKRAPSREGVEQVADIFNYQINTQPFDRTAVQQKLDERQQEYFDSLPKPEEPTWADYAEVIDAMNKQSLPEKQFYALYDINGDGVEDLLLGKGDGSFSVAYTIRDGKAQILQHPYNDCYWVCENHTVEANTADPDLPGQMVYHFMAGADLQVVDDDLLIYQDGQWHRSRYWDNIVSEEEAQSVMDKYPHVNIEFKPSKDYPE